MADTQSGQTISSMYDTAQATIATIAKIQAENAELRKRCNMPESTVDCVSLVKGLFERCGVELLKERAKIAKIRSEYEALIKERAEAYAKLQNLVLRLVGSVDVKKHQDNSMLQPMDYDELVDYLEIDIDKIVAAQNGRNVRGDGRHRVWLRTDILDEYIQNDDLLYALTLLKPEMFEYIVYKVEKYIKKHGGKMYYDDEVRSSNPGNRSKLKMRYEVFICLFRKRSNDVPVVIGALFGMHRTTVDRQCDFLDEVLEKVLPGTGAIGKRLRAIKTSEEYLEFTGGKIMHDGTLVATHDSSDADNLETPGWSGKHGRPGFLTVISCIGNGLLVAKTGTVPGNWHDMKVFKRDLPNLGLFHMEGKPHNEESAKVMRSLENYMDKGFIGIEKHCEYINAKIPTKGKNKKSPKEIKAAHRSGDKKAIAEALGLTVEQLDVNRSLSSTRSLIECMIGRLKKWEITSGTFRGTASDLNRQIEILSGIVNLEILWPEIEQKEGPLLAMLAARRARHKVRR